ncbi:MULTISPECIES: hypothetical protein [unclassified Anaerobiospirillum]|uniref:LpxL/LpxP family acyltransferase n=1 Tax=unclassified Anaerobiospirillum TaxID=2647410 RepID=UPI001FF6918E|nr:MULTISPECIES: hypothetical protein [unclassified Anaerobiospirillum]MCK0534795.1 hypothetical protein [Anaerobiospirillum sp. NML120511]MCK0539497.1 hypothetical protein [Anaerobiospirillum sp. NML02-A-032]
MGDCKKTLNQDKTDDVVIDNAGYDPHQWRQLLGPKHWGSWAVLGLLFLLAMIPNRIRDGIAWLLSWPASMISMRFRDVTMASLNTAFYGRPQAEIRQLYRRMLMHAIISGFSYGEGMFLSRALLQRRWVVTNPDVLCEAVENTRPIIFCVPHTFAIDRSGLYLSCNGLPMFAVVNEQKNPVFNWFLNRQRIRFGGTIHTRSAGFRSIVRALKNGRNCYFLCDEDLGPEHTTTFVNFFGTPKSMVGSLPKLARMTKSQVLVLNTFYDIKTASYVLEFNRVDLEQGESNEDYLQRVSAALEAGISRHPEQYMWFLRVFKTVPDPRYFSDSYINCNKVKFDYEPDYEHRRVPYTTQVAVHTGWQPVVVDYEPIMKARLEAEAKAKAEGQGAQSDDKGKPDAHAESNGKAGDPAESNGKADTHADAGAAAQAAPSAAHIPEASLASAPDSGSAEGAYAGQAEK